jgi:hypothetical protein
MSILIALLALASAGVFAAHIVDSLRTDRRDETMKRSSTGDETSRSFEIRPEPQRT